MRLIRTVSSVALLATCVNAQVDLVRYDFSSDFSPSGSPHGWVAATPITINAPGSFVQFGRLCVLQSWPDSSGYFEFTVHPGPAAVQLDRLFVEYIGSTTPTINHVRVTSSLDGHTTPLFERTEDMNAFLGSFAVDLSAHAEMQDVDGPVVFRVGLERVGGWDSQAHYEIDQVVLYGDEKPPTGSCAGTGGATLKIVSPDNSIIDAGSPVDIVVRGTPNGLHALVFDPNRGALDLFPFGELCTTLSPQSVVVPSFFPPTGELVHSLPWPADNVGLSNSLCCTLIDVAALDLAQVRVSNRVCIDPGQGCEEEIGQMQLLAVVPYTGTLPVQVVAEARDHNQGGDLIGSTTVTLEADGSVTPGAGTSDVTIEAVTAHAGQIEVVFRVDAANFEDGNLPYETWFYAAAGTSSTDEDVYTYCPYGLSNGFVYGDFTITEIVNQQRPDECHSGRKPGILTLTYTGSDCSASSHSMDDSDVPCSGDPLQMSPVWVRSSDKGNPDDSNALVWFEGWVELNESFEIHATNAGEHQLKGKTYMHVFDQPGGTELQEVRFKTSCSKPLRVGDQFGAFKLVQFVDLDDEDECGDGAKPAELSMRYDGLPCSRTRHGQDPSRVTCNGDPGHLPMVWIRASDKSNPTDSGADVWFENWVTLGDTFVLSAANAGETKLKNDTHVHLFDVPGGTVLQHIKFHSSCSERLRPVRDQYGAVRLLEFVPE